MKNPKIKFPLKLLRFYTKYFPIDKGKYGILNTFLRNSGIFSSENFKYQEAT